MFRESELPLSFNSNRYTLLSVCGIGGMAMVYEADVDLDRFDFAKVIAASEVDPDESRRQRLVGAKARYLDLRNRPTQSLREYCDARGLPYPASGKAAVKILLPQRVEGFESRFRAEWQHLMAISDPHLVEVYGGGKDNQHGVHYYAMELLQELLSLKELCRLDLDSKLEIICQAAEGLQALHRHGLIHRDVKPHNLMCRRDGSRISVKVSDLGIAKDSNATVDMTGAGLGFGSVCYMSPEQAFTPSEVTTRADIYSLGATLYQLLSGRAPYEGLGQMEVMQRLSNQVPPIGLEDLAGGIPAHLAQAVRRMMDFAPERRPSDLAVVKAMITSGESEIVELQPLPPKRPTVKRPSKSERATSADSGVRRRKPLRPAQKPRIDDETEPQARDHSKRTWIVIGSIWGLVLVALLVRWIISTNPEPERVAEQPTQAPVKKTKPRPTLRRTVSKLEPKPGTKSVPLQPAKPKTKPVTRLPRRPKPKPDKPSTKPRPISIPPEIRAELLQNMKTGRFSRALAYLSRMLASRKYIRTEVEALVKRIKAAKETAARADSYARYLDRKADGLHEKFETGEAINALREALLWASGSPFKQRLHQKIAGYRQQTLKALAFAISGAPSLLKTQIGRIVLSKKFATLLVEPQWRAVKSLIESFREDLAGDGGLELYKEWQGQVAQHQVRYPKEAPRRAPRCATCHGLGSRTCGGCDAKGRVTGECVDCLGTGKRECARCRARGWIKCKACGAKGCDPCLGTGWLGCPDCRAQKRFLCVTCKGKGKGSRPHFDCSGTHVRFCSGCNGLGMDLSKVTRKLPENLDQLLGPPKAPAAKADPITEHKLFRRRQLNKSKYLQDYGGSRATESAVLSGLVWLSKHQSAGGNWDGDGFQSGCKKNTCSGASRLKRGDIGLTGLALQAYIGAGQTHLSGRFKQTVRRGLRYLIQAQDSGGRIGPANGVHTVSQAICAVALAEAYAMTRSPQLRKPAELLLGYLLRSQNNNGWHYGYRSEKNDVFTTSWVLLALEAGTRAGFNMPLEGAYRSAETYIESITDESYYLTGYKKRPERGSNGPNSVRYIYKSLAINTFRSHAGSHGPTAMATVCRVIVGYSWTSPRLRGGGTIVASQLPVWDTGGGGKLNQVDLIYWYFGSEAMFRLGGTYWKKWNKSLKPALVHHQRIGGDESGSWDPIGAFGQQGGRVFATAINVLTLETYYRCLPLR